MALPQASQATDSAGVHDFKVYRGLTINLMDKSLNRLVYDKSKEVRSECDALRAEVPYSTISVRVTAKLTGGES